MITTTYWQSLELLQAKLDRDTCDFVWKRNYDMVYDFNEGAYLPVTQDGYHLCIRRDVDQFSTDVVPAWSLDRLWEIVSKFASFSFEETDSPESIIEALIILYKEYGDN